MDKSIESSPSTILCHDVVFHPGDCDCCGLYVWQESRRRVDGHPYNNDLEIKEDNRYFDLFNVILDWEVTPRSSLEDDTSPQFRALQWLAYDDTGTRNIEAVRTRYALATLYYSTHNVATEGGTLRSWHDETHWLSSYPVCLWHGVECHDEDNTLERVKSLNLTANGMGGTFPDELSMLELDIHFLDISDNGLEGTIPESITKMRNLRKTCPCFVLDTDLNSLHSLAVFSYHRGAGFWT